MIELISRVYDSSACLFGGFCEHSQRDPAYVFFLVSILFFIPLWTHERLSLLDGSAFDASIHSLENLITLSCTLAVVFPLLIDVILDMATLRRLDFLSFRVISLFSLGASSTIILAYNGNPRMASVSLVMNSWGYWLEMGIVMCFLKQLIPEVFTLKRVALLGALCSVPFVSGILNTIPETRSFGMFVVHYASYSLLVAVFSYYIVLWIAGLLAKYRTSGLSFRLWLEGLSLEEICAIVFVTGLCLSMQLYFLVIVYFDTCAAWVVDMSPTAVVIIEVARCFLCVFTYTMSSRLFRERLLSTTKALEIKSEFVKYIGHELRTPIGAMSLGLSIIHNHIECGTTDQAKLRASVSDLKEAVDTIAGTLNDLLLYEKFETGSVSLSCTSENPFNVVTEILASRSCVRVLTESDTIEAHDTLRFLVDKLKLKVILDAILAPAYMAESSGTVDVSFDAKSLNRKRSFTRSVASVLPSSAFTSVVIHILDCRSGESCDFTDRDLQMLRLERVGHDDERNRVFSLWIASKLLQCHNATMRVYPDTQGGVLYELEFPLTFISANSNGVSDVQLAITDAQLLRAVQPNRFVESAEPPANNSPPFTDLHEVEVDRALEQNGPPVDLVVMFVDDSTMIRKLMAQFIRGMGYNYFDADNGATGVHMYQSLVQQEIDIDVILMDYQMPVMTGPECTCEIRALGYNGIIIGVTGNLHEADVATFLASGADHVLEKPLAADEFYAAYWRIKKAKLAKGPRILPSLTA